MAEKLCELVRHGANKKDVPFSELNGAYIEANKVSCTVGGSSTGVGSNRIYLYGSNDASTWSNVATLASTDSSSNSGYRTGGCNNAQYSGYKYWKLVYSKGVSNSAYWGTVCGIE